MSYNLYLNLDDRTLKVYGRRVKTGCKVEVGTSTRAAAEADKFPGLKWSPEDSGNKWWTNREVHFVHKMVDWWRRHPWVSQYRIAKTLQRSVELSHRTYASIRSKLHELAWQFGVAYTQGDRNDRWTMKTTVDDGRLVRGKHLIVPGGYAPEGAPVPEDPRMARRRRR